MVYCEGKSEDGTYEMRYLARSQNCQIWNGSSCQELTRAIYGQHRLWTVLLKMNRMYPRNEACNSHCKTMFKFRIWCKNISSDASMWKLLSIKWIFCLASVGTFQFKSLMTSLFTSILDHFQPKAGLSYIFSQMTYRFGRSIN